MMLSCLGKFTRERVYGCPITNSYPPSTATLKKKKSETPYWPTDICPTASWLCLILSHMYLPSVPTFFIFQMLSSVFNVYSISNVFSGKAWRVDRVEGKVMKSHSLYQQNPRDCFICYHFHSILLKWLHLLGIFL